jgi:aspartate aminotransferase
MPASPIRKLVPFAEKARAQGKKIYPLNIGQPDILTPPRAIQAVQEANIQVLAYSHSAGNESYRRKLVGYYTQYGANITHEDIIVTTGASEAIRFAMMSCLDAHDEIIIPEPFYANYNGFAIESDINVVPVTASIETGFALPPIAEFEKLITPKTKAIFICNPSNPTGYLYSLEELLQLREIVTKHNLFLFVDEVYREFCYDGRSYTSVLSIKGLEDYAIVMDSISKRYSACGGRIGTIVSKNKEVMKAAMKFAQARLSPPSLAQILAEATLDVEPSYITDAIHEYDLRRQTMVQRLQAMQGVVCPNPGGAFYIMVQLPIDDTDKFCQWLLEDFDHHGETLMMAPGSGFYASPGLGTKEARLAYVLNRTDIHKAMDCLEQALKVYPGRTI